MKKLADYKILPVFPQLPVSDPQISPDGKKVLFTYSTTNMEENKYDRHIWMFNLKERRPRQFTHGKCNDGNPKWSPNGKNILFLSNRLSEKEKEDKKKRKMQIWVIPADGGESTRLSSIKEGAQRPEWSPDGKTVLFSSSVFKGEKLKDSDVKIVRRIRYKFDARGFFEGKWTHLFSVSSKGGKAKQLTDGEFDVSSAKWAPDGKQIAFVSNFEEDADLSFFRNIYIVQSKGGEPELLWKGRGPIGALGWSPDGKYLAFTGRVIEDPSIVFYKNTDLWILPIDGGEPKNLTASFDRTLRAVRALKWSPDSKYIYFNTSDYGRSHICRVDLYGEVERVTKGKMTAGGFSLDGSGSIIAFTAMDAMTPSELCVKDEKGMRRLTNMNRGLLKKLRLSEPEEFWFTASDGVKVQGWIVKPRGFKEGEKYPMIIQIHGGPRSDYGFKLMAAEHEFQVLADHGYVVVYTNPRASVGYGEGFAAEISGHWGERDYQDIMEAVDYVIEAYPFVDLDRLGVAGGSYGGFMTNWIVGHTNRFKAAVTMRSISNWYSFHGTSDIGWMSLPTHELSWGKDPWDNLQVIMEKSPITYIKNMKTPLLIIHSEADYRCPIEQAEQLFIGLKKLKRDVEFVRFPNEPHGLSRTGKPKHRVERLRHIVRWFDRYLK